MNRDDLLGEWKRLQTEVYHSMTPTELNTAYDKWFGDDTSINRKDMVIELMESEIAHKRELPTDTIEELISDLKFHLDYD